MNQERLLKIVRYSGIHRAFRPFYSGIGSILMLHRIAKRDATARIEKNRRSEVSPEYLEFLVNYFTASGYEIVSLDELGEISRTEQETKKMCGLHL